MQRGHFLWVVLVRSFFFLVGVPAGEVGGLVKEGRDELLTCGSELCGPGGVGVVAVL